MSETMNKKMVSLEPQEINQQFNSFLHGCPIFEEGEVYDESSQPIEKYKGIYRQNHVREDKPVVIVGRGYQLIQHEEFLNPLREMILKDHIGINKIEFKMNAEATKVFVSLITPQTQSVKIGDIVALGLRCGNGIGKMSLFAITEDEVLKCLNRATHPEINTQSKFRHMGIDLNDFNKACVLSLDFFGKIIEKYNKWSQQQIPELKFKTIKAEKRDIERVIIDMNFDEATNTWIQKNLPSKYIDKIRLDKPKTQWELYNSLTGSNTHDEKRDIFTKQSFDHNIVKFVELFA